jgi:hypothetical protein
MKAWELNATQVEALQGTDGGPFRDFVNRILYAHAATCGIPSSAISTDSRNVSDGGVDSEVSQAAPNDVRNRLRDKTCWQFKATSHTSVSETKLQEEVGKDYSSALLKKGYAYRFCIADTLTAEKKARWEAVLNEKIKQINPSAPSAQVLTSTCLAEWASQFPALLLSQIPVERFLHLGAWGRSIILQTKKYVPVANWKNIAEQIALHIDYSKPASALIFPIHGDAGIGKTRLVYESLSASPDSKSLVIYTNDEDDALNLAHFLASSQDRYAILVVDECSPQVRYKINECLRGNESRVRAITISNFVRNTSSPEPTLEKMPDDAVEKILKENFPDVSDEQLRAAVSLAGGFIKIAADICQNNITGGLINAGEYYHYRIPDQDTRKVVEAISLVKKVGFNGDSAKEFDELCELVGIPVDDAKRRAKDLKDSLGFVAIGGRYFYITPEAIARVALQNAWNYWIKDNPSNFFKRIPGSLLDAFQTRVAHSGSEEFRAATARYFTDWMAGFTAEDLSDKKKVDQLIALVDTDPVKFLPALRRMVENAKPDELIANTGYGTGAWGPRRYLVWLCERLAGFREFFDDCESILFKFALYETEPGIGNNATAIWNQFYNLLLSGTSVSYLERIKILKRRLASSSIDEAKLALGGLKGIFNDHAMRTLGPAVVAGRIPPKDWEPQNNNEYWKCYEAAFELYEQIIVGNEPLKDEALNEISKQVFWFLRRGFADSLIALLRKPRISDDRLPQIVEAVDLFFSLEKEQGERQKIPKEYYDKVRSWKSSLTTNTFRAKLVSLVGRYRLIYEAERKAEWEIEAKDLVSAILADPKLLESEFAWATGKDSYGCGQFGFELGKADADAILFELILSRKPIINFSLTRGYIIGLLQSFSKHSVRLNEFLDSLEINDAPLAFDFASTLPIETKAFERWKRLYDSGRIPAQTIRALAFNVGPNGFGKDHLREVLTRLVSVELSQQEKADSAAVDIFFRWIQAAKINKDTVNADDSDLWQLISQILRRDSVSGHFSEYEWGEILKVYIFINPSDAVSIAAESLKAELSLHDYGESILTLAATAQPELVMNTIGKIILDPKDGWKLQMRGIQKILNAVTQESVLKWLEETKHEGASKIAGSLPRPYVDDSGSAIVPPLTLAVLERYSDDPKVVRAFICTSGIRSFSGDIAAQKLQEAKRAEKFLQHPLAAIREWAAIEKQSSEEMAARYRQQDEEMRI